MSAPQIGEIDAEIRHDLWGSVNDIPALTGRAADGRLWSRARLTTSSDRPVALDLVCAAQPAPLKVRGRGSVLVAVGEVELFCGFTAGLATGKLRAISTGLADLAKDGPRQVLAGLADPDRAATILTQAGAHLKSGGRSAPAKILAGLWSAHPGDPMAPAVILMNHIRVRPGQALPIPPGVAYQHHSGVGVEVSMADDEPAVIGIGPDPDPARAIDLLTDRAGSPTPRAAAGVSDWWDVPWAPMVCAAVGPGEGCRLGPGDTERVCLALGGAVRTGDPLAGLGHLLAPGTAARIPAGCHAWRTGGPGTAYLAWADQEDR